ncbi:sulfotransferase family protein [Halanaerobium congolense]|uniref:Sulfotransferase family protein n=1 Tax=Halanaerobium congolense TaxID=54121 RepID=A0A318DXT2_9FIRM|nr:sulfotransferase family protein [Halanaerobium congolense]PXV62283.1 sulfotransferase family protein [Halanaerobium congolense]
MKNPYNKYDDKHKCIFIHIPKAAGTSVSYALFGDNIGHRKIKYLKIFNEEKFDEYFKFTFVRNPYSRIVSAYNFLMQGGMHKIDDNWAKENLYQFENFDQFILALKENDIAQKILNWQHFAPQHKYICDYDFNIMVDFIGKLENINKDFNYIKNKLNINSNLSHKNKSKHKHYSEYYTEETKNIVKKLYKKDFDMFGYVYEEKK